MLFKGSGVALITPFDKYNNVNYDKLEELIEFQIQNKTDAIIVCGTTRRVCYFIYRREKRCYFFCCK